MIATHGPTLVLPDRDGVANYFILRRVSEAQTVIPQWTTHGIILCSPTSVFPFGMARVFAPNGTACTVAPHDSTKHPLELLAEKLGLFGVRAEHLLGEEPL